MSNIEKFLAEHSESVNHGPAFIVKASINGIQVLYGIYMMLRDIRTTLNDLRDLNTRQSILLDTEEACEVLQVTKNTLGNMVKSDHLIEGYHYMQYESTRRFHPDLHNRVIKRSGKAVSTSAAESTKKKPIKRNGSPINKNLHNR